MTTVKVHKNIWGNLNGYVGREKIIEFGCGIAGEYRAKDWLGNHLSSGNTISDKSYITEQEVKEHEAKFK